MPIVSGSRDLLLACCVALAAGGIARGETLGDAMALAYQSNPTLQAQRATQRALDETYVQAMANYRPQITVQSAVTDEINNASAVGATSRLPGHTETNTNSLQITQPLYTGGRIAAAVSAAVAGVLAGRETLRAAEETTLQNVVQVYVDVRRDQESVEIAQENVELLQRQLDESHARFAVGDITRTDVALAQTRVSGARAQLASARATLATSRATYLSVVGETPGKLEPEPSLARLLPAISTRPWTWPSRTTRTSARPIIPSRRAPPRWRRPRLRPGPVSRCRRRSATMAARPGRSLFSVPRQP